MKYIVIILLLSTSGVERIELKTTTYSSCGDVAKAWREVNTTYHGPGPNQGNYTPDGKLMIGWICN